MKKEILTFEQMADRLSEIHATTIRIEEKILKAETQSNDAPKLLNINQAAEFLTLSPSTIYGLVFKRKIPFLKRGKRLYFKELDLINWIETGRKLS